MALLEVEEVRRDLKKYADVAPNGFDSLATLPDVLIRSILVHPDEVKLVQPQRFNIILRGVDSGGYVVLDKAWLPRSTVVIDPDDPSYDVELEGSRSMTFGKAITDQLFMETLRHGEHFYICYNRNEETPRTIMCVVLQPGVVQNFTL